MPRKFKRVSASPLQLRRNTMALRLSTGMAIRDLLDFVLFQEHWAEPLIIRRIEAPRCCYSAHRGAKAVLPGETEELEICCCPPPKSGRSTFPITVHSKRYYQTKGPERVFGDEAEHHGRLHSRNHQQQTFQ